MLLSIVLCSDVMLCCVAYFKVLWLFYYPHSVGIVNILLTRSILYSVVMLRKLLCSAVWPSDVLSSKEFKNTIFDGIRKFFIEFNIA